MFLYCLLLFSAGIVFSFLFTKTGEVGFVAFLGAVASLATIGAAITAIYALNIWYPQFKHSEKFKALKKLREILDAGNSAEKYIESVYFDCMRKNTNETNSGTKLLDARHEAKTKWRRQCLSVERCWDDLETLFSQSDLAFFSDVPKDIDSAVESHVQNIEYMTSDGASVDFIQLHLQISDVCQNIRLRTKHVSEDSKALISKLVS
ncbi:hypothetical protein C1X65_22605 [Pseudomonas sp. FW305-70]|nr:hypothetical protein C1X65_22605 [Pseudomonas sp. FW305-70]